MIWRRKILPFNFKYHTMKTKLNLLLVFSILILSGSFNGVVAQKSIELKYNLKVNDQFSVVSQIEQTIQFDANGQKIALDQDMTFYTTSHIDSVKNDLITQRTTFNRIVMNQQIFGMEINYDSDDSTTFNSPMGPEFAEQMNKLINASVISVMNDRGQIKDVDLSALGDAGETPSSVTTGNNYAVYPDHKVKVGESWESELETTEEAEMVIKMVYTLKKATRKEALLDMKGDLSANITNPDAPGNLSGTITGTMTVDSKTGMVKVSSIQMDMTLDIEQNGSKFPATISSFVDTKIEKVE